MEIWEYNRHIARIVSGKIRIKVDGEVYYVCSPSRIYRCLAEEIFSETLEEARINLVLTQEQMLKKIGWTEDHEKRLKLLSSEMERLKVALFESRFRSNEKDSHRKSLDIVKREWQSLFNMKHVNDYLTDIGIASSAKQRFLLGYSIYLSNNTPYWVDDSSWFKPDNLLDRVMFYVSKQRIDECEFREIARNDPWKTIWAMQKNCREPLFEGSSIDLTDDQKSLLMWSMVYDNAREHPDNLDDEILNDDDMFDGWLILKRKERDKNKSSTQLVKNEKIRNAPEQFIMVNTTEDANRVMNMNDQVGLNNLQARMKAIKEKGVVSEQNLPDTALRLQMERNKAFAKGK